MIDIKFTGGKELAKALERAAKEFPKARESFLRMEAERLKSRVVPKTPADTGRLRGGWQVGEVEGDEIEVGNNVEYAAHVEYGHRVKMFGRYTGNVVPGQFFLRDAVEETAAAFPADAQMILARIFR